MSVITDIKSGLFSRISSAGLGSVAWPNVPFSGNPPFLRVFVLPAQTETVGLATINRHRGIIQIDCVVAAGGGEIDASDLAGSVIATFPRGAEITSGTTTIRVNQQGWAGPGQQEPDRYFVPVSIPYEVIT
jgi:hypothetical protein